MKPVSFRPMNRRPSRLRNETPEEDEDLVLMISFRERCLSAWDDLAQVLAACAQALAAAVLLLVALPMAWLVAARLMACFLRWACLLPLMPSASLLHALGCCSMLLALDRRRLLALRLQVQ